MFEAKKENLKEKLKGAMPEEAARYIVWQLDRLGELGETTAEELMDGTIDPKKVWKDVTEKASKKLHGKSGAVGAGEVFGWLCELLHIDGVVSKKEFLAYATELMGEGNNEPSESGTALDFDSLFE